MPTEHKYISDGVLVNSNLVSKDLTNPLNLDRVIPDALKINTYWESFTDLIDEMKSRSIMISELIEYVYDPNIVNLEMLNKISEVYGISAPLEYPESQLRLLLTYYPFFLRIRGTLPALSIISLIGRDEISYYKEYSKSEITIRYQYRGYYTLHRNGINEDTPGLLKLAQSVVDKVTRAGIYYKVI